MIKFLRVVRAGLWGTKYLIFPRRRMMARKLAKKREFRFAITKGNERVSNVWKAWAHKAEFYLSCSPTGGDVEFSFHQSGQCHYAFSPPGFAKVVPGHALSSRFIRTWQRAEEQDGIQKLAVLVFPGVAALTPEAVVDRKGKPVHRIEGAPPGYAVVVHFGRTPTDPTAMLQSARPVLWPLNVFPLSDGTFIAAFVSGKEYEELDAYLGYAFKDPDLLEIRSGGPDGSIDYAAQSLVLVRPPPQGEPVLIHELSTSLISGRP